MLSRNEQLHGANSELVIHYIPPPFGFTADRVIGELGDESPEAIEARFRAGIEAPLDYDVFHCYFGRSLFSWEDLPSGSPYKFLDIRIAKALGRRIVFTLQGCDVRQAARSNSANDVTMCRDDGCQFFSTCVSTLDAQRRSFIDTILPMADRVFALNPELCHDVKGATFLPYSNVEINDFKPKVPATKGPIRIVHAPSDPAIKGTVAISAAVEALKQRHDIEFTQVQGLLHEEAMSIYQGADLVIDQIYAGWYGGFAVEAMAMGKPVLTYLRDADFVHVPDAMMADMPVRSIHPNTLVDDIEKALLDRPSWPQWSKDARRFVETWHNPSTIASQMLALYASDDPAQMDMDFSKPR